MTQKITLQIANYVFFNFVLLKKNGLGPRQCQTPSKKGGGLVHAHASKFPESLCCWGSEFVNKITELSSRFVSRALISKSQLIASVFSWASSQAFTAVAGNNLIKWNYVKFYSDDDMVCADFVREVKLGRISFTTRKKRR